MAQKTSSLKRIIRLYSEELAKMGIRPERILLFGSRAKGTARKDSDIDLIVVSPDFGAYNQRERLELLGIAAARILEPVQAQGFTPMEINDQTLTPFWERILREQAIAI
jgi:predicted nucleotidyltransferase